MSFRVVILFKNGVVSDGINFPTKEKAETYILLESEAQAIKRADIKNLDTGERERAF